MLKVELDVVATSLNDIEGLANNLVSHRVASLAPSLSFLSPTACLFGHELKAFSRDDMVRARVRSWRLLFFFFSLGKGNKMAHLQRLCGDLQTNH